MHGDFEEAGELAAAEWPRALRHGCARGAAEGVALFERRPVHTIVPFTGADGVDREVAVTAFPLMEAARRVASGSVRDLLARRSDRRRRVDSPARAVVLARRVEQSVRQPRQKSLVLILAREFASNLATPIYIADADERLVYFNEPAERDRGPVVRGDG